VSGEEEKSHRLGEPGFLSNGIPKLTWARMKLRFECEGKGGLEGERLSNHLLWYLQNSQEARRWPLSG